MAIKVLLARFGAIMLLAFSTPAFAASVDEEQIKKLVQTEMEGAATHDIDKVMSVYWHSKDFVLYDAVPGEFNGWDALKADYEDYFKTFPGKPDASFADLHVGTSGDLGYAFSIQTWKFKKASGEVVTSVQRVTNIYRRIDGQWLCIHEHASIPVNMLAESKSSPKGR